MARNAALIFAGACALTILFQIALILGAPWGHLTMGGKWPGVLPPQGRLAAAVSALLLAAMAATLLASAGFTRWRPPVWAPYPVAGFMGLSVLMHLATPSAAERALWLPIVLVMAACALAVIAGRPRR